MSLVLVRHGPTADNKETPGPERVRSWHDVPLHPTLGPKVVAQTGRAVGGYPVAAIYSSDLQRALQTVAPWVMRKPRVPFHATPALRPWHLGALIGQNVEDVKPQMQYFVQHPAERVPGGESLAEFFRRFSTFIWPLIKSPQLFGVVTHLRNVTAVEAMIKNPLKTPADLSRAFDLQHVSKVPPGGHEIIDAPKPAPALIWA